MSEDIIVRMQHVRAKPPHGAHLCVRGCKAWFDERGLDFKDFLDNGIPIATVDGFNDAIADRVAAAARAEHAALKEVANG